MGVKANEKTGLTMIGGAACLGVIGGDVGWKGASGDPAESTTPAPEKPNTLATKCLL